MTYRERAAEREPHLVGTDQIGGVCGCPRDYNYLHCPDECCPYDQTNEQNCSACWNRRADNNGTN